jgi:hypothetical protein
MNCNPDFFVALDASWMCSEQLASSAKTRGTLRAVRLRDPEITRMFCGGGFLK